MSEAVLISVGGSPNPIIYSLNSQKPNRIVFFASNDSYSLVHDKILPNLAFQPKCCETIITPDEQDLLSCVKAILQRLPVILRVWKLEYGDLIADYTGGTKTMSAAAVLALADHISDFSYVGGTHRDKGGLGVVIDGREQMLYLRNPWDILAVEILNDMALMFNRCRFRTVADLAKRAIDRAEEKKPVFEALRNTADAFCNWDNFHYDTAHNQLKRAFSELTKVCAIDGDGHLRAFCHKVGTNLVSLGAVVRDFDAFAKSTPKKNGGEGDEPADGRALILDLLANAVRRAEQEHKYDDAVARLYSAIEKMAKIRLIAVHNIDNSDVKPADIPAGVREKYIAGVDLSGGQKLQLPLQRSYELLAALSDPLGMAYNERQDELGRVLTIRNNSLMVHGFDPVSEETYKKMLHIALDFVGIREDELPRFPDMRWGQAGL